MNLTLPDGTSLTLAEVIQTLEAYQRRAPAVINLYDNTNIGPHNEVLPVDLLSLTAMHTLGSTPMEALTPLWCDREKVTARISKVSKSPLHELTRNERTATIEHLALTIAYVKSLPAWGVVSTSKLLHRLRPNVMPIWDTKVGKRWYAQNYNQSSWTPWLNRVYDEVTSSGNLDCLQAAQEQFEASLPLLRIWDMILWERSWPA